MLRRIRSLGLGTVNKGKEKDASEVEVEWQIPNFFPLSRKVDQHESSPVFKFSGETWYIEAYLNGESHRSSVGYLGLYLYKKTSNSRICMKALFFLKTAKGFKELLCHTKRIFNKACRWGIAKCIKISRLLDERENLVPSDVLTIVCLLKLEEVHIVRSEMLFEDMKKMLHSGDDSDVTFCVKGVEFRLHKNILRSHSPVFCAMLKHDMKTKRTGVVDIDDCEVNTFRQLVEYVYFGTIEKLTEENVFGLFEISDRYELLELKNSCVVFMINMLSADNFVAVITLAKKHNNTDLLETASEFFTRNMKAVITSEGWQQFMIENTAKANELLFEATNKRL